MSVVTADGVKRFIISHFADAFKENNVGAGEVADDLDLMKRGVIDSIGVIYLISAIEEHFNIEEIDFEDMDAEKLTVIGPLCAYIADRAKSKST